MPSLSPSQTSMTSLCRWGSSNTQKIKHCLLQGQKIQRLREIKRIKRLSLMLWIQRRTSRGKNYWNSLLFCWSFGWWKWESRLWYCRYDVWYQWETYIKFRIIFLSVNTSPNVGQEDTLFRWEKHWKSCWSKKIPVWFSKSRYCFLLSWFIAIWYLLFNYWFIS